MARIRGFPPISRPDAHTLMLGSMPSRESLLQGRYYAHPRNAFWPIVCDLLGIESGDYERRARLVAQRGFAVWDVLESCVRPGSGDADIEEGSIVANDFAGFFADHPKIQRIFFNGAKAETVYLRHVLSGLEPRQASIPRQRLPSTSPANAALSLEEKKRAWRAILAPAVE
jgi:hypoxanthine-DNA glycosylase